MHGTEIWFYQMLADNAKSTFYHYKKIQKPVFKTLSVLFFFFSSPDEKPEFLLKLPYYTFIIYAQEILTWSLILLRSNNFTCSCLLHFGTFTLAFLLMSRCPEFAYTPSPIHGAQLKSQIQTPKYFSLGKTSTPSNPIPKLLSFHNSKGLSDQNHSLSIRVSGRWERAKRDVKTRGSKGKQNFFFSSPSLIKFPLLTSKECLIPRLLLQG